MSRVKEMDCYICGTIIKVDEPCYWDKDNADPCHTDCLLRHAEEIGDHQTAKEIMEQKKEVGRE